MRALLSLRWRIIVAILSLALGTTLALSLLARHFINLSLHNTVNLEAGQALEDALELAKENYSFRKGALQSLGESLADTPALLLAARRRDETTGLEKRLLDAGVTRAEVRFVGLKEIGPSDVDAIRAGHPLVYKIPGPPERLLLLVPVMEAGRPIAALRVSRGLGELVAVERATQTYEHLRLLEGTIYNSFLLAFSLAAAAIVAITCVVGIRMGFSITNPLYGLLRATRELARDNLRYRIPKERDDEIGLLIDSFNRMAADLEENQRLRLEAEKMVAWQEIARRLAHEIKNPLTPIQLTVQQMRDKYQGDDERYRRLLNDCTEIATEEVDRLRALVQEFAEFARLPSLALSRLGLNAIVGDAMRIYPDAPIEMDLQDELPDLDLDPDQMHRVFINLIDNGLAAAGPTGHVTIQTRAEDGFAYAVVSDSGPGVSQEDRDRIFEPYVSGKRSGMGLGLAIVKSVVENHNGQIRVSDQEQGGARFEIKLPIPDHDSGQTEARV
jgi:signal transduction histidine kinase